jgi:hypothetical protein
MAKKDNGLFMSSILEHKNYRAGVRLDVENVATNAKTMTGKPASKLSNDEIKKANREYDDMHYREGKAKVHKK